MKWRRRFKQLGRHGAPSRTTDRRHPCASCSRYQSARLGRDRGQAAAPLSQAGLAPQGIVDDLRRLAVVVAPTDVPRVVPTDPDDDHVIAAAVAGQADVIASGEKCDLMSMGSCQGIPIITAAAILRCTSEVTIATRVGDTQD